MSVDEVNDRSSTACCSRKAFSHPRTSSLVTIVGWSGGIITMPSETELANQPSRVRELTALIKPCRRREIAPSSFLVSEASVELGGPAPDRQPPTAASEAT